MNVRKLRTTWFAAGAALAGLILTAVVAYGGSQAGPPPHVYKTIPPTAQDHATGGPYIDRVTAEGTALRVGSGPGAVVSSVLVTVGDVTRILGFRAVGYYQADDLEVWLVLVHGPFTASYGMPGQALPTSDHYYVIIQAKKGEILAVGAPSAKAW